MNGTAAINTSGVARHRMYATVQIDRFTSRIIARTKAAIS